MHKMRYFYKNCKNRPELSPPRPSTASGSWGLYPQTTAISPPPMKSPSYATASYYFIQYATTVIPRR